VKRLRRRPALAILTGLLAAAVLLIAIELADGAGNPSDRVANPCRTRHLDLGGGLDATVQRIVLDGLDGAACNLGTSRERLVLALAGDEGERLDVSDRKIESAVRSGLRRSLDEAAARGDVPSFALPFLRKLIEDAPIGELIRGGRGLGNLLGG
jgi:hypothetical protein